MVKINMKKSDLRNGMIVECKDGIRGIFLGDRIIFDYGFTRDSFIQDDLTCKDRDEFDIIAIYQCVDAWDITDIFKDKCLKLLWKRERKIDYNKVPRWTRVQVRDNDNEDWKNRYFLGRDGKWFLATGRDKFSYEEDCFSQYEQCRIHSSVDIKEEWYK